MSIKLIASDMDGTLLDPQGNLTPASVDAIRRLADEDIEFLICSGRDYLDAKDIMDGYGIRCSYICLSGAVVYDHLGEIQTEIPLTAHNLIDIEKILTEHHVHMDILTSSRRYSTAPKMEKMKEIYSFLKSKVGSSVNSRELEAAVEKRIEGTTFVSSLRELPQEETVFKICGNGLPVEKVTALKEAFSVCPDLAAASSFPTNIELTNDGAQKGHALKAYAERKGISLDNVMVLGDSDNDLSMFTPEFGWTVAMENSMSCILDAAKYRTKSNAEDGVAWAIRNFVFREKV
ncbi:MAG: HAD family hydrolase [Lacrimispora sp.]